MANAGFGAAQPGSVETRSLTAINSRNQSFANKDFVKNIAWLNNSVDTLSSYTQLLQKGVDNANQNFIEQIQGFAADLFVLFAGGEPTGIDIGDLKYVFQGLGALLGVNPDTPFPLNLVDAANHLFGNWIVPLPQFTDVIFDAMTAWAEDLGLSEEFINSLKALSEAIVTLNTDVEDFITDLFSLLNIFGTDFGVLEPFWNALSALFGDIDMPSLEPVLQAISNVGVPVINSLTWVVETVDSLIKPLGRISGGSISDKGENVLPAVSNKTTQWTVGSGTSTMWVYDDTEKAFKTVGSGITKSVITQHKYEVIPGNKLELKGSMKWLGIPFSSNGFQIAATFYSDETVIETIPITIPTEHGITGGWETVSTIITVPPAVNRMKVGAWIDGTITTGTVWVKDLSISSVGLISKVLVDGLVEELLGLLVPSDLLLAMQLKYEGDDPSLQQVQAIFDFLSQVLSGFFNFAESISTLFGANGWEELVSAITAGPQQLWDSLGFLDLSWAEDLFSAVNRNYTGGDSVLAGIQSAFNSVLGLIPGLKNLVSISSVTDTPVNIFSAGSFGLGSIVDSDEWVIDTSTTRSVDGTGAARIIADGNIHALNSGENPSDAIQVMSGQDIEVSIWVKHQSYSGSGIPVVLQICPFVDGVRGEPVEIANYVPAQSTTEWPGKEIKGTYTVPEGVSKIQTRLMVMKTAVAGTFWFDDGFLSRKPLIKTRWIPGFDDSLQEGFSRWQLLLDTLLNGLSLNNIFSDGTLEQLTTLLNSIPSNIIKGILGPADIGGSISTFLNLLLGGFINQPNLEAGLSDAYNIATQIGQWATLGAFSWDVLGIRNNRPLFTGFLPSGKSNFNLTDVAFDSSPPLLDVTQSASVISIDRIEESSPIGVISWIGKDVTDITAFYVNIWKIDDTGALNLVHHSPNILGNLDSSGNLAWNFYDLEESLNTIAGEEYGYELVPVGAGTYKVIGKETWLPNHPRAQVVSFAATRNNTSNPDNPPGKINKGSVTRSIKVAWIESAINSGNESDYHTEILVALTKNGTTPIPRWANFVDGIVNGPGGGGHASGPLGFAGKGGDAGAWAAGTWRRGVDFDSSVSVVTFTKGVGGDGGTLISPNGGTGTNSTLSIPGHTITATGGAGGDGISPLKTLGHSSGEFDLAGVKLKGGGEQKNFGSDGASPGGGGGGGDPLIFGNGGKGADGAGWLRFRQAPIDGEGPISVENPLSPTIAIDSVNFSSISVTATKVAGDVQTVIGFNYYLNGVKKNISLEGDTFTYTGLNASTDYSVTAEAVGPYGNKSPLSVAVLVTTSIYTPGVGGLLSTPDQALVDSIVENIVTSGEAWGASIQISGPTGNYSKAYGLNGPSEDTQHPARALSMDDHFRIGSCTKTFTAWAVMMELDAGHINLTDKVSQHIPADVYGRRIPYDDILTIEHLLTMRSSLAEYLSNLFLQMKLLFTPTIGYSATEHLDWIKTYGEQNYGQTPMGTFNYSNSNYIVLGEIVKNVSGKTIKQYIQENIITPLGMTETSWPDNANMPEPYTRGKWSAGGRAYNEMTFMHPDWGAAAGAIVSTHHDLQLWGQEMLQGALLSPEVHDMWINRLYDMDFPQGYSGIANMVSGYGFANIAIGQWRGHGGSIPGYNTGVMVNPTNGAVVTIMENFQEATSSMYYERMGLQLLPGLYPGSDAKPVFPKWSWADSDMGIQFDSANGNMSTTPVVTWTHTATEGAYVLVAVNSDLNTITATYDGVPMTLLSTQPGGGSGRKISQFGIGNVSAGAKTISVSSSGFGLGLAASSVSYIGVGSVHSSNGYSTGNESKSSWTRAGQNVSGGIVVATFSEALFNATFTVTAGGTKRYSKGPGNVLEILTADSKLNYSTISINSDIPCQINAIVTVLAPGA